MQTARDVVLAMEPPVLDTHVAALVAMSIWESVQHRRSDDGALTISRDEQEMMQRVMMDVVTEATGAKAALEACEGGAS